MSYPIARTKKSIQTHLLLRKILVLSVVFIPILLVLTSFFFGHLTFWLDPARDLSAAWDNLHKLTLLGPSAGIPGLFYGPYWIWLLSIGLFFSKDPIIVTFITAALPYCILFPILWFKFTKYFEFKIALAGWLLFMLSTGITYATQLWNPYPAPLITLAVVYVLLRIDFKKKGYRNQLYGLLAGLLLGLVINFHISFGIALTFGSGLFVAWSILRDLRNKKMWGLTELYPVGLIVMFLCIGFVIAFLPTLLFEIRHGFQQTQTLLQTFLHYGAVTNVKGLSQPLILQQFITTLGDLLRMPGLIGLLLVALMIVMVIWSVKTRKIHFSESDRKIIALLLSLFAGIAGIYLTAKNAVWEYHFIGVDLLFLLLITFLVTKLRIFRTPYIIWTAGVTVLSIYTLFLTYNRPSYFQVQKDVIRTIANDAQTQPYEAASYTHSAYSFDNQYLFRWLANKSIPSDPNLTPPANTLYLILPVKDSAESIDFVNAKTPRLLYKTVKTWNIQGSFKILKRVKQT